MKEKDAGAAGRGSKGAAGRLAAPPLGRASARSFWEGEAAKGAELMRANAPHTKVFIVHGHDDGAREAVARFIQKLGSVPQSCLPAAARTTLRVLRRWRAH